MSRVKEWGTGFTQSDGTLLFLISTYLRDYASNAAICHFLMPETNKDDFNLYFEL